MEISFSLPQRTTDDLPLPSSVSATLCRGFETTPCGPIPAFQNQQIAVSKGNGSPHTFHWKDVLPGPLTSGQPRLLVYRVQLDNPSGRNAGWSSPAYAVAGAALPPVEGLHAEGTPRGILLHWLPLPSSAASSLPEVLLRRESLVKTTAHNPSGENTIVWLATHAGAHAPAAETLDSSALMDVPYRYTAVRRQELQIADHAIEVRSAPSSSIEITLRDVFPPPVPTNLSAAPFTQSGHFAVDLAWDPVTDPMLAGYNVRRQKIDLSGAPVGPLKQLNAGLLTLPAFHDATADSTARYRYSITAVDGKGNESAAASVLVEPSGATNSGPA